MKNKFRLELLEQIYQGIQSHLKLAIDKLQDMDAISDDSLQHLLGAMAAIETNEIEKIEEALRKYNESN